MGGGCRARSPVQAVARTTTSPWTIPGPFGRLGYDENIGRIPGFAGENRTSLQQSARLLMLCARDQSPCFRPLWRGLIRNG